MVVTLILILLVVIFMACFIGFNLSNVCAQFWFFKTYSNVPVSILVLISFAAGIVFALLFIFIAKMKAPASDAEERAARKLQKKAKAEEKKAAKDAKKKQSVTVVE